jgi:transposase
MSQTEIFFSEAEDLKNENQSLKLQIKNQDEKIKHYEEQVERLHEMLAELKRSKFGVKSERWESDEQLVFNEVEFFSKQPEPSVENETDEIKVSEHTKKRGHRKPLPKDLDREVIVVELPQAEQFAEDGATPLKVIGYEISEKLSYEPAKVKVIEYHRAKYGVDAGDYVKTAPTIPSIIPRSFATPELVASIVTKKYAYGMPLYRIEEMFKEIGVDLPRQTQARWVIAHAEASRSVYNILCERLLSSFYVSCDETYTQVLKENGKPAESKSWMWVRSTPHAKNKIILFDYDSSRSAEAAKKLFEDYAGYLQVDGYAGYNILENKNGLIRIGCNMHGRRYFEQANTEGAKSGKTLAEVGLTFYQKLYELEEEFKLLDLEEKQKQRLEKHVPIWNEFKLWVDHHIKKVPPKSKIGKAFKYLENEYENLIGYLKDPRLEMDNGFVERAIRKFAIGRNNWMFSDTTAGAEASAMFYSLLVTAKVNGVNTYDAMKYLFEQLPKANLAEDIEHLADIIMGIKPIPSK